MNRRFKRTRDQLTHINYSYRFLPTNYTSTLLEHVINTFPNLLHFLGSRDVYRKEKGIPLVGQEHTPPSYWSLELKR
jgi:hypothetical protein